MSRDFLASQLGREFKPSPNRDRITRGAVSFPSAIFYYTFRPVFVEFFPITLGSLAAYPYSGTRVFYQRLTSTLEIIAGPSAGLKTIEVWIYNSAINKRERESFFQAAGWPQNTPVEVNVTAYPTFVTPTMAVDQSVAFRRTLELSSPGGTLETLSETVWNEFLSLSDYFPSQSNIEITTNGYNRLEGHAAPVQSGTFASISPNSAMPYAQCYLRFGQLLTQMLPLQNPAYFQVPEFKLQKTRVAAKPSLIWSLRVTPNSSGGILGGAFSYPIVQSITEVGCRRQFTEPADRIYLPNFSGSKTESPNALFEYIFGPMAWTQIKSDGNNAGPSGAGYPKPTCYPDIT